MQKSGYVNIGSEYTLNGADLEISWFRSATLALSIASIRRDPNSLLIFLHTATAKVEYETEGEKGRRGIEKEKKGEMERRMDLVMGLDRNNKIVGEKE